MKVIIVSPIDQVAIGQLRERHDVVCDFNPSEERLLSLVGDRDALVVRSGVQINSSVLAKATELKLVCRAGSGCDNIDVNYLSHRGIQLERIPLPGAKAVAELAIGLMISLARNIAYAHQLLRQGRWEKDQLIGCSLSGKTLGIIGAGSIGCEVGRLASILGMEVVGCVGTAADGTSERLAKHGIRHVGMPDLLSESDFISLHVPLNPSTQSLIDADTLLNMKRGVFLINLARGGVVDEIALLNAIRSGQCGGAALDVHSREGPGEVSPLAHMDNIILTPHIGAATHEAQREIGQIVVKTINEYR